MPEGPPKAQTPNETIRPKHASPRRKTATEIPKVYACAPFTLGESRVLPEGSSGFLCVCLESNVWVWQALRVPNGGSSLLSRT